MDLTSAVENTIVPTSASAQDVKSIGWTKAEEDALDTAYTAYCANVDHAMDDLIIGNTRNRRLTQAFWKAMMVAVPSHDYTSIHHHLRRKLKSDSMDHDAPWDDAQDLALKSAYQQHPDSWTTIAKIVRRNPEACRSRWVHIGGSLPKERKTGSWDKDEEEMLKSLVLELQGRDGKIPWKELSSRFETRTPNQCREKCLCAKAAGVQTWSITDTALLLEKLENLSKNVKEQSDISWSELCWGKWAVKDLKKHWRAAKSNIEDVESMTLIEALASVHAKKHKKKRRED